MVLADTKLGAQQKHSPFILFTWNTTSFSVSLRSCCSLLRLNSSNFAVRSAFSSVLNLDATSVIWSVVSIKVLSWNSKHNSYFLYHGWVLTKQQYIFLQWSDAQTSFWAFEEKTQQIKYWKQAFLIENKPVYCWPLFPFKQTQELTTSEISSDRSFVALSPTAALPFDHI